MISFIMINLYEQEESTIGFLHYSLKFYKSGEQYIAKFQKKLAEATKNSKLENVSFLSCFNRFYYLYIDTISFPPGSIFELILSFFYIL